MESINNIFNKIESFFLFFSKASLIIMMIAISYNSIARYFFSNPLNGIFKFTEDYLMVIIVFLSMSYVMKVGSHIRLDFLFERLNSRTQNYLNIVFFIFGAVLFFFIGYQGWMLTYKAFINNTTSAGIIPWPLWLSYIWVFIGSILFCSRLLLQSLNIIIKNK